MYQRYPNNDVGANPGPNAYRPFHIVANILTGTNSVAGPANSGSPKEADIDTNTNHWAGIHRYRNADSPASGD